ncbi:tRNA (adenosine(37)-N6)-threonylcarbamoyltransferase complex ATPase subunit type 1 TsaE [[Eubacterium] hominis]|uniref:tRNA (adenosine(37)-N6)-threonylcarbamoyltransferase complex ATPase subunit type 1 TsaE n=1 Tax=[Eubacterium] hominis TaxID=2764325 RepID=UPI003A4E3038
MKEIVVHSLAETAALGEKIGKLMFPGALLTLTGDLGAGKTTLTKSIGKAIGIKKVINSPTFTILKTYHGDMPFYHIDAYRLEGITQDLGFEEVFDADGVCVVEWPHFIENQLPKERLEIEILRSGEDERTFCFKAIGEKYEKIVRELV